MGQSASSSELHEGVETDEQFAVAHYNSSEEEVPDLIDPDSSDNAGASSLPSLLSIMAEGGARNRVPTPFSDDEDDEYGLGFEFEHPFYRTPRVFSAATILSELAHAGFRDSPIDDYSEGESASDYTLSDESFSDFEGATLPPGITPGGYDYEFLETPSEEFHCSVCLFVLRNPQLTSCCGHHFCEGCINRVILRGKPCPLCQEDEFTVMLDKNFQRKIYDLKVKCSKHEEGCEWVGDVKTMTSHTDERDGDCGYVKVSCKYKCGEKVRRRDMAEHIDSSCSQRPFVCKYCGHKASYSGVTDLHYSICTKYPIPCPNDCGVDPIPREALRQHKEKDCSLEIVSCEFHFVGCSVRTPRKDMSEHISDSTGLHLGMVAKTFQLRLDEKDKEIASLKSALEEQKSATSSLQVKLNQQQQKIQHLESKPLQPVSPVKPASPAVSSVLNSVYCYPPVEFVMRDFPAYKSSNQQWFSEPFYTSETGYKMCLSVFANGIGMGKGTHISIFANMMRGEFDNDLHWPFRGSISAELRMDCKSDYYDVNLHFTSRSPLRAASRVVGVDRNPFGQGIVKFIPHSRLQPPPFMLRLRVRRVNVI